MQAFETCIGLADCKAPPAFQRHSEQFFAQAKAQALQSPIVTAPDGRRVHAIGVRTDLKNPANVNELTTSLDGLGDLLEYPDHPEWWISAPGEPKEPPSPSLVTKRIGERKRRSSAAILQLRRYNIMRETKKGSATVAAKITLLRGRSNNMRRNERERTKCTNRVRPVLLPQRTLRSMRTTENDQHDPLTAPRCGTRPRAEFKNSAHAILLKKTRCFERR